MPNINDRVLDLGLNVLDIEATALVINSTAEPTTYTGATGANLLGTKSALVIGAPAARTPSGRKVTIAAFTDGSVSATGTAGFYAVLDVPNLRLLAAGPLGATQAVTSGNTFSLPAVDIGIPGP